MFAGAGKAKLRRRTTSTFSTRQPRERTYTTLTTPFGIRDSWACGTLRRETGGTFCFDNLLIFLYTRLLINTVECHIQRRSTRERSTLDVNIYEGVNQLYVGRKVVIVIEFTPTRGREREGTRPNFGPYSEISIRWFQHFVNGYWSGYFV
jgi:hypothetical protein